MARFAFALLALLLWVLFLGPRVRGESAPH